MAAVRSVSARNSNLRVSEVARSSLTASSCIQEHTAPGRLLPLASPQERHGSDRDRRLCRFFAAVVAACEAATNLSTGRDGVTPDRLHLLHFFAHLVSVVQLASREQVLQLLYRLNRVVARRLALIEGSVADPVRPPPSLRSFVRMEKADPARPPPA